MNITIKVSGDLFKNLDNLQDGINDGITEITKVIFNDVYNRAPEDTLELKKTMHATINKTEQGFIGKILTAAWYWFFPEYGAAPHDVKIKTKKLLSEKADLFGKTAHNVRTPKKSFVRAALTKNKKWANQIMMTCIKRRMKFDV